MRDPLLHKEKSEKHLQTRDLMKIKQTRRHRQGKQSPALMKRVLSTGDNLPPQLTKGKIDTDTLKQIRNQF